MPRSRVLSCALAVASIAVLSAAAPSALAAPRAARTCTPKVVTLPSRIAANRTLTAACVAHYLATGQVTIPAHVTLTVGAGVTIEAVSAGRIQVSGALVAKGTAKAPVRFTSTRDDARSTTRPAAGNWRGIHVSGSGRASLAATYLRYARTALSVDDGASVAIRGRIQNSTVGVDSPDSIVDARHVYWGSSSGPSPVGSGTPVVGSGVFATPWTGFVRPARPARRPYSGVAPNDTTCSNVLFIGARGSGEGPQGSAVYSPGTGDRDLLGPRLLPILDGLMYDFDQSSHPLGVRTLGLRYPAAPPPYAAFSQDLSPDYLRSIYAGVDELEHVLAVEHTRCPGEKIVLAGYSQGALVVHLALHELAANGTLARYPIRAVELVADPVRTASDADFRYGGANAHAAGVWTVVLGSTALPASLVKATGEICHLDDAVCDATRPTAGGGYRLNYAARGGPHASYPVGHELDRLADHAAARLG